MYDVKRIRAEFPILSIDVNGSPYVYLDNGATTQKPKAVIDSITESYSRYNANIHRGVHKISHEATERHEAARSRVAQFINAAEPQEILFVRGTTEAINLVASSYGSLVFREGCEVIVTTAEHHSNIVPWQMAGERFGLKLRVAPLNELGEVDLDAYASLFNEKTVMVAITHVSNVLGTINPVKDMIQTAHLYNVPVLVDGAQAVAHQNVDVQDLDADFYAFSAHKAYGPVGIGVLYGKRSLLDAMPPYQGGGEMISKVTFEKTTYNELPYKFEAGTPDYVGSVALSAAIDYMEAIGLKNIAKHEHKLLRLMTEGVESIPGSRILGTSPDKSGVLSFLIDDIHPYDIGMLLDQLGIAVRTGHHCAEPLMDSLNIVGTVRASLGLYNTEEDVERFLNGLKRVVSMF